MRRLTTAARLCLAVWGTVGVLLAALALAVGGLLWKTRGEALHEGEARVTRFVAGAEASMNRALLAFDVLLATADESLGGAAAGSRARFDAQGAGVLLRSAARQNPMVRHVALLDAQGRLLASSATGGGQQAMHLPEGFLASAMAPAVATLTVSAPQLSRVSSERVLYMARQLRLGDGTRLLAVAQVPVDALVQVLMQGMASPGLEITLERGQGEVLIGVAAQQELVERQQASVPPLRTNRGTGDEAGRATSWPAPARLSGEDAVVAARPLLYPDLWLTASLPREAALAGWVGEARRILGAALLLAVLVVTAGVFAMLYLKRMHRARRVVARSKATLDQALGAMVSGFVLLDADGRIVQWNQHYEEMFPWLKGVLAMGLPYRRVLETTVHYNLPGMGPDEKRAWVEERLMQQRSAQGTFEQKLPSGQYLQLTERATPEGGLVIVYHDVTDLRRATAEVESLAFYDPLTCLPNRRQVSEIGRAHV